MAPQVSFIIPCSQEKFIFDCLDSIYAQDFESSFEVICVLNGIKNENLADLLLRKFPKLQIIQTNPKGAGHARNTGAQEARGKYFAFIDSDVVLDNSWLKKLYSELNEIFTCAVGQVQPVGDKPKLLTRFRQCLRKSTTAETNITASPTQVSSWAIINAAAFIIERNLFLKNKGFKEYLQREEDLEFSLRIYCSGYHLVIVQDAIAYCYFSGGFYPYLCRFFRNRFWLKARPGLKPYNFGFFSFQERSLIYLVYLSELAGHIIGYLNSKRLDIHKELAVCQNYVANLEIRKYSRDEEYCLHPKSRLIRLVKQNKLIIVLGEKRLNLTLREWENLSPEEYPEFFKKINRPQVSRL